MGVLGKVAKLAADPTLRRWLWHRLARRGLGTEAFVPHRPAYLTLPTPEAPRAEFPACPSGTPAPLNVTLPGAELALEPGLFARSYPDGETLPALHRFAWVPLYPDADPRWVDALWREWAQAFAIPADNPAWEAYAAAERAVNLLDFARRRGLPDGAEVVLAGHVAGIAQYLEYFGEHGTCNHLANNGRGLYHLGLELGMEDAARAGLDILRAEVRRLIRPSGMLREASTHYHLLYLRNFADCWLAARRHGRPEADELATLVARLWAVVPNLVLPGGMPLMGDISPDSPPEFLAGLLPGAAMDGGWTGLLPAEEKDALAALRDTVAPCDGALLAADGWVRADFGPWAGLWHVEPAGWRFPTGHGHEDLGAPEIHLDGAPLFIDPGRGAYGEAGEAALYASAGVHGGLQVDGADPFPVNKPYYSAEFRAAVTGQGPRIQLLPNGVEIAHGGFKRLAGLGPTTRRHRFETKGFTIEDDVGGRGNHAVTRRLVTAEPVTAEGGVAIVGGRVRVSADAPLTLRPLKRWTAYGRSQPATALEWAAPAPLPWRGLIRVERL